VRSGISTFPRCENQGKTGHFPWKNYPGTYHILGAERVPQTGLKNNRKSSAGYTLGHIVANMARIFIQENLIEPSFGQLLKAQSGYQIHVSNIVLKRNVSATTGRHGTIFQSIIILIAIMTFTPLYITKKPTDQSDNNYILSS